MTGARKSREEADGFFAAQAIQIGCRLVSELTDADDFPSAVVFSVMRRDISQNSSIRGLPRTSCSLATI